MLCYKCYKRDANKITGLCKTCLSKEYKLGNYSKVGINRIKDKYKVKTRKDLIELLNGV